jgi:hypothetical protein
VKGALEVVRAAYGVWLLTRPKTLDKVLAVRHLAQAGGTLLVARDADHELRGLTHGLGAGVDTLHSLSMLGFAACSPSHRREALHSALVAAGFGAAETLAARLR